MPINVNMLPYEVLEGIFFYLENCQRLEAALVCQDWLSVLNCKRLVKGTCLRIDKDNCDHIPESLSPTRKFDHIKFVEVSLTKSFLQFFVLYQYSIHKLSIQNCLLKKDDFSADESKLNCDKLKHLEIQWSCDILALFSSLKNLEQLILCGNDIKDCHLERLQQVTARLKMIRFENVSICKDKNSYKKQYPNTVDTVNPPSAKILSVPFIKNFVAHHRATLEDLSICKLPPSAVSSIASIPDLKLKKFVFPNDCKPSLGVEVCRLQPSLISLEAWEMRFENSHWEEIVHLLPHLQCVSLNYCQLEYLSPLLKLRQLRELEVNSCETNGDVSITAPLIHLKKFEYLELCGDSLFLMTLLPKTIHIQDLYVGGGGVNDEVMWLISATLTDLKFLHLDYCSGLTDAGLTGNVPESGNGTSPACRVPISNLKGLTTLTLVDIHNITEEAAIEAIRFPFLVHLELSYLGVTERSQPTFFERNPCLRKCIIKTETD